MNNSFISSEFVMYYRKKINMLSILAIKCHAKVFECLNIHFTFFLIVLLGIYLSKSKFSRRETEAEISAMHTLLCTFVFEKQTYATNMGSKTNILNT